MSGYWRKLEGQQFNNKYYLKKFKGAGTFGAVFEADEVIADSFIRTVAIKIFMPPDSEQTSENKAKIMQTWVRELQIAITLKHPSLIDCYTPEAGEIYGDQTLGLVMELGTESLDKYLETNTLSAENIKALIKSVAEGLVFIHSKNIVHRDLKPGNLLRVEEIWKIGDFGVSKQLRDGQTTHTNSMGTAVYAPPEAYDEEASSIAWDVWSLGILTAQLVTNNHPFAAQTLKALMKKVLFNEPEIPQNIPSPFKEIIEGCLIKERANRWSAKQILNALESNIIVLITAKADYRKLDQLLAAKNWKDADIETGQIMCKIMGREKQGWLTEDNCKNFPREELKIIDSLWVKHSNGYYGFSVLKEIWTSAKIGGKVGEYSYEKFKKLGDEVGWRKGGNWLYSYSDLSLNKVPSIKGHFPVGCCCGGECGGGVGRWVVGEGEWSVFLFSSDL